MSDTDDPAAVGGLGGGQQPTFDECVQLGGHGCGQLVTGGAPADGMALLVHGHQPQQPREHVVAAATSGLGCGVQGRIGMCGQRSLYAAKLLVPGGQELSAPVNILGELGEGEGQQRQGVAGVGVLDELAGQGGVHTDPRPPEPVLRSPHAAPRDPAATPRMNTPRSRSGRARSATGQGTPSAMC